MTLAFVQFYFLGQGAYFALTEAYGQAFRAAYQRNFRHPTQNQAAQVRVSRQIHILHLWRRYLGSGRDYVWQPPGAAAMGSQGGYVIASGTFAEWQDTEHLTPTFGPAGIVHQYLDYPYQSFSISRVYPYGNPSFYPPEVLWEWSKDTWDKTTDLIKDAWPWGDD